MFVGFCKNYYKKYKVYKMSKMNVNFAIIGYGKRARSLLNKVILNMNDVNVVAVCDKYEDRASAAADAVETARGKRPFSTVNYKELLEQKGIDAVFVASDWETHIEIAVDVLEKKIPVALEVGGAYNIESLWRLVRTQENTKTPLMFMENCCFGKWETLVTSLVRNGLFGDIVHCHGCYGHYLCPEIAGGNIYRHYRLRNYISRNCENYPTHELGPIAKLLNINRGNRMLSLVSVASRSEGMEDYIRQNSDKYPELVGKKFRQGDIVNTIITCADGSTISLRLDTTLPRSYSREFTVRGTRGMYEMNTNSVYFAGEPEEFDQVKFYKDNFNNITRFEEKYQHPIWKGMTVEEEEIGHGGMDAIEFRVFVDRLKKDEPMPIDVYDAAAWMSVTALSEASVAAGGMPQSMPDFTSGAWVYRRQTDVLKFY